MISLSDFEKWLNLLRSKVAAGDVDRDLEAREAKNGFLREQCRARLQQLSYEIATRERQLQMQSMQKLPWWRFIARRRLKDRIESSRANLRYLTDLRSTTDDSLELIEAEWDEIQSVKRNNRSSPEIWRNRAHNFRSYAQDEYAALKRVRYVRDFWVEGNTLVVETDAMICTGMDIDGTPLLREIGILRVSYAPMSLPKVFNTNRTVRYANDVWDAPHHPRRQGSCWGERKEEEVIKLLLEQGNIAKVVDMTVSTFTYAKPLSAKETWGVPVLRLFPEAKIARTVHVL